MSSETLPQEIEDAIIDNLTNSSADLKNCSLVTKSWLPRSRKHLFRRMHISPYRFSYAIKTSSTSKVRHDVGAMISSFEHLLSVPEIMRCVEVLHMDIAAREAGSKFNDENLDTESYDIESDHMIINYMTTGYKESYTAYPCRRPTLLASRFSNIESVVYDWGDLTEAFLSDKEGFSFLLMNNHASGVQHLSLRGADVMICIPPRQMFIDGLRAVSDSNITDTPRDLFECLAAYAPSLQTLCVSAISYADETGSELSLDSTRQVLSAEDGGQVVKGQCVTLRRLYFRPTRYLHRTGSFQRTYMIVFENQYTSFEKMEYLALEGCYIIEPGILNRLAGFHKLTHLTLFDSILETLASEPDPLGDPDTPLYELLPSLTHLQLVLSWYSHTVNLCQIVLGPSLRSSSQVIPRARVAANIHLHLEYTELVQEPPAPSPSQDVDILLQSYLAPVYQEATSDDHRVFPVEDITVNWPDSITHAMWPRTAETRKLWRADGDFWWDTSSW